MSSNGGVQLGIRGGRLQYDGHGISVWRIPETKNPPSLTIRSSARSVLEVFLNGKTVTDTHIYPKSSSLPLPSVGGPIQLGKIGTFRVGTLTCRVYSKEVVELLEAHRKGNTQTLPVLSQLVGGHEAIQLISLPLASQLNILLEQGVIQARTITLCYAEQRAAEALAYFFEKGGQMPKISKVTKQCLRSKSPAELQLYIEQLYAVIANKRTAFVRVLTARAELQFANEQLSSRRQCPPGNLEGFENLRISRGDWN